MIKDSGVVGRNVTWSTPSSSSFYCIMNNHHQTPFPSTYTKCLFFFFVRWAGIPTSGFSFTKDAIAVFHLDNTGLTKNQKAK